jgi:hypothetical protein
LKVKDEFLYFRAFHTVGLPCYRELLYAFIAFFILIISFLSFHLHCNAMRQLCTTVPSPPLTDRVPLHIISRKRVTNPLTSWNRELLDHLYPQLVKKFSTLYEARRSLLCLQEITACPFPETDHSRPRHLILFL